MDKYLSSTLIYILCIIGIIILIGVSFIVNEGNVKCYCNSQEKQ